MFIGEEETMKDEMMKDLAMNDEVTLSNSPLKGEEDKG